MDFTDAIKSAKPSASAGSVKTYNSLLRSIHREVFKDQPADISLFSQSSKILPFLNTKPANVRKTYLSALQSIAPSDEYRALILQDTRAHNAEVQRSELNEKLEESAITDEEVERISKSLNDIQKIQYKRTPFGMDNLQDIQNWVIFNLYVGNVVPRRSLDYVLMKHKNYNKDTDNYFDVKKKMFVFNRFKTDKYKGQQSLDVPPALMTILKKWIKVIPDNIDTLLFNSRSEPLSAVTLNQRLNIIFDGPKSVNALRHYYLTKNYKHVLEGQENLEDDMEDMGSNVRDVKHYVKTKPSHTKTTYPSVEAAYADIYKNVAGK